jgi:hypothetical protein
MLPVLKGLLKHHSPLLDFIALPVFVPHLDLASTMYITCFLFTDDDGKISL